jgi:hypothetical protein
VPEITLSDEFGRAIATTVWAYRCSRIIEIGSWDGTGSTTVLIAAMKGLDNPSLTCLEPNPERHARLQRIAAPIPWVKTVCKPSISAGGYTPRTFADVWQSPYNRLRYPREQVEGWWNETIANATSENGYLETLTDERWDAALIDGCEFAGYDDYRLLKERVRVLLLDDVFTAYKCAQAHDELGRDSRWSCVWCSSFVRSGASIWVKH